MKKWIYTLLLLATPFVLHAQSETGNALENNTRIKNYDGFILDMSTMLNAESLVVPFALPSLSYLMTPESPLPFQWNPDAFKLNPAITYLGQTSTGSSHLSILSPLYNGMSSGKVNWQGTSYKLKNGMRINLYGEYNADGHKVYNPSALPWERNNFHGAFEMKSANGNFGIKVEVHRGRNNPF